MNDVPNVSCTNHWETVEGLQRCSRCQRSFCHDCLVTIGGSSFCAQCKHEQLLDVKSGVTGSPLASIGRRFAAQLIDGLLWGCVLWAMVFAFFGNIFRTFPALPPGFKYFSYSLSVVYFAYEALMLSWRGQTLGKIAMRVKVVRPDGSDITRGQAWGRSAVRAVMVSFVSLINYLPAFFTDQRTCVHDMAAKTRVVNWGDS